MYPSPMRPDLPPDGKQAAGRFAAQGPCDSLGRRSGAAPMEFDFINDTTATAYFHTGLGNFVGTYNGGTIDANTSFAIAPGGTVTGLDITSVTGGKLLLS